MANVKIGSARSSFGNASSGDQNGGKEVSTQNWYLHSKGWIVLRAKDPVVREKLAVAMERACANNDIGYSQPTRNTLYNDVKAHGYDPAKTTKKVNTDCSALVRVCMAYAGIMVDDFITSTQVTRIMATNKFDKLTDSKYTRQQDHLLRGDILVTKTKGHTVIVLTNGSKAESAPATELALGNRLLKNGMEGADVKELQTMLIELGYDCGRYGADGDFGDATEQAVREFQRDTGLSVDGKVGVETVSALRRTTVENGGEEEDSKGAKNVVIVGGNCYIRAAPNTSGEIMGVAKSGEKLVYQGVDSEDGWHLVIYSNKNAWVSGKYSRLE